MKALILVTMLLAACGGRAPSDPVDNIGDVDATCIPQPDALCSPERDEAGAREGCANTYDCCMANGCGAGGDACDCCSFADARVEDCS